MIDLEHPQLQGVQKRSWAQYSSNDLIKLQMIELCAHVEQFEKQVCFELLLIPFLPTCLTKALKISLVSESLRVWFMN